MTSNSFSSMIDEAIATQSGSLRSEWRWVADRAALAKDKQAVFAALDAAAGGRGYYVKADVRPSALTSYLPKICLFDPVYGEPGEAPVDGYIRLMGTWVERFYGYRTGYRFSEAQVAEIGQRQLAAIQSVWRGRKAGRTVAWGHKHEGIDLVVDALYVPLMDKDGVGLVQYLVHVDVVPQSQFEDW